MEDKAPQEINIYHLLGFYIKRWVWILSLTIVGIVSGLIYNNYLQTPLYKSDATLLVVSSGSGATTQDATLINNYIELLKSRRVLEPVIDKQKLDITYDDLLGSMEAASSKGTQVMKVSISTKDARTSQLALEGAIESFRQQVTKLYVSDNIRVVDDANLSGIPYNVHKELVLAVSTAAGFLLSVVVLFIVYDFNLNRNKNTRIEDKIENQPKIEHFNRRSLATTFRESMRNGLLGDVNKVNGHADGTEAYGKTKL